MLFNSQLFILLFLPAAWLGWRALAERQVAREWWLIAASFFFFGWWDWRFLPLLAGSIVFNWTLGRLIKRKDRSLLLAAGAIAVNLTLLGIFKYLGFARDVLNSFTASELPVIGVLLPIGISFYTFQQISYLADRYHGTAPEYNFRQYALFVSFFPQIIAGPIVRHNELIPQFGQSLERDERLRRLGQGIVFFVIGIAKKYLLADQLAPHADSVFSYAATASPGLVDAWTGLLAFSFQIFFDFSAYSDMAIGLGLMFGYRLPINFNAPYRARSVRDFWRRWHITLSQFFRDYVYIPLGGNRRGLVIQLAALMITMGLCGLWHGAGWGFVLWGLWHGAGLCVNALARRYHIDMPFAASWFVTFSFVTLGWVLFRSPEWAVTEHYVSGLMGGGAGPGSDVIEGLNYFAFAASAFLVAIVPETQDLVYKYLKPNRIIAVFTGLLLAWLVLELGEGQSAEFIYFQF